MSLLIAGATLVSASAAPAPSHNWDFRGCTTGAGVTDVVAGSLVVTPMNGPTCSADGIVLDGNDDYADTAFEVYVKYNSFNNFDSVFYFGEGDYANSVYLCNNAGTSTIDWTVRQGSKKDIETSTFDSVTWTHVVVTVKDTTMKVYKNWCLFELPRSLTPISLASFCSPSPLGTQFQYQGCSTESSEPTNMVTLPTVMNMTTQPTAILSMSTLCMATPRTPASRTEAMVNVSSKNGIIETPTTGVASAKTAGATTTFALTPSVYEREADDLVMAISCSDWNFAGSNKMSEGERRRERADVTGVEG
jgi:hypothetical protein